MKTAVVFAQNRDVQLALRAMLESQKLRIWHTSATLSCEPGAAGYVSTSDRFGSVPLVRESAEGNWLVVAGVPIHLEGSLTQTLDRCVNLSFEPAIQLLEQLDGAFAAVLWNRSAGKLVVITDILGMQPLYMRRDTRMFALASDSKALTASELAPAEVDPAGWGAFFSMKHPLAGGTLVKGIQRVPPASVLVYEPHTDALTSRTYWHWPSRGSDRLEDVPLENLVHVFLAELKAYLQHNSTATLCLSGGFDSRLILAGLAEIGEIPKTMSLSHADELFDVDGRIARRMAAAYSAPFAMYDSDTTFYSSQGYVEYLIASEVATPSLYLFIAQLCSKLRPEMQAIWEGVFPGCILYPVHQPPGGFNAYLERECGPVDSLTWKAARLVFHSDLIDEMKAGFESLLDQETSRYTDDEFGVSQFVVRNRTRHRIAMNPMQIYSNDVIPFTPGISKQFWSIAAAIPYTLRAGHALYQHIFRRFFPKSLTVPAVSGTTPYAFDTFMDADYLRAHLGIVAANRPKVAGLLRFANVGHTGTYWQPSKLVETAIQEVVATAPELSTSGVRKIKEARAPHDPETEKARELLFYWTWWSRIYRGEDSSVLNTAL
jgi:hypothetical protein